MKKTLALLLAMVMLFSLAACGAAEPAPAEPAPAATEEPAATEAPAEEPAAETVMFTDSCGREVELPANITKIAPSGTVATMILAAFAPEENLVARFVDVGVCDGLVVAAGGDYRAFV